MPYSFLKEGISLKCNSSITDGEIIKFNFIGISRKLIWPIDWNNERWERLWQFNIHYFDWIKDIDIFENQKISYNYQKLNLLLITGLSVIFPEEEMGGIAILYP